MVSVSTPISSASVFSFGNPFQTEAFVNSPLTWDWRPGQLPCGFLVQETGSQGYRVSIALEEQEGRSWAARRTRQLPWAVVSTL